jgi:transposase
MIRVEAVCTEPVDMRAGTDTTLARVVTVFGSARQHHAYVFANKRHVRGKWCCAACRTLVQAPVPAAVIDKGIPTAGLLAQVLVAKHADHLPLYRQEAIFCRAGLAIPRSTLGAWVGQCGARLEPLAQALKAELLRCQVLHADETPVAMLAPGRGKTQRAYLWAYAAACSESIKAVVYDFTPGRSGEHARVFLGHDPGRRDRDQEPWVGHLVCDDFSGYKALFELGVTEVGCMAHARRKFVELHAANKSSIAGTALELFGQLYEVERDIQALADATQRLKHRRTRAGPIAKALHDWMTAQRGRVPPGTATAKALDYSLNRWAALTRYLDDARLPIDNNHDEQQIRPWATGRKNWLFAGTLAAGQRAAAITSLIQSAKLNGHDPYVYLKDVLERLPTQRASDIGQLLPHRWTPVT